MPIHRTPLTFDKDHHSNENVPGSAAVLQALQIPNLYNIDRGVRAGAILFRAELRKLQHHGWDTSMPVPGSSRLGLC